MLVASEPDLHGERERNLSAVYDSPWGGWSFIGAGRYDPHAADGWPARFVPTCRDFPAQWTRSGKRRHDEQTVATIAFLQGHHVTRRDVDELEATVRYRGRIAEQVRTLTDRLLADVTLGAETTGPMPRQRDGEGAA